MATLLAFPLFIFITMLQTVVVSRLNLLEGSADLILLVLIAWGLQGRVKNFWVWSLIAGGVVSFVTAVPFPTTLVGYLVVTGIVQFLQKRVWQVPILAMLVATILGTFIQQGMTIAVLRFTGVPLAWDECLSLVVLPSVLLNALLSLPVYVIVTDLASVLYPAEVEV